MEKDGQVDGQTGEWVDQGCLDRWVDGKRKGVAI